MNWKFTYSAYQYKLTLLFILLMVSEFSYALQPASEKTADNVFQNLSLSKKDNKIIVTWSVLTAQQNVYYEIERAGELMKFKTVGILFPEENKSTPGIYIFKDNPKRTGKTKTLYYRIKQVQANEKAIYSFVKQIKIKEHTTLLHSGFICQPVHNYFYCAEKQLLKKENNNKVAGILRNKFVFVRINYNNIGILA